MSEIRLVGTAHVSQKSVEEVRAAIEEFQPDVVAIELDNARYLGLQGPARSPSLWEILKSPHAAQLLVIRTLASVQRRIGMDVGVEPGAEMKAAIAACEERGIQLALIDRDIRLTFHRFWHSIPATEKLKLFCALAGSLFISKNTGEYISIDEMTGDAFIEKAMDEFHLLTPKGAYALITERDAYMTYHLLHLAQQHERVLAVVGAGHRRGITAFLSDPSTLPPFGDLTRQIRSRPWGKIFLFLVLGVFLLLLAFFLVSLIGPMSILYLLSLG